MPFEVIVRRLARQRNPAGWCPGARREGRTIDAPGRSAPEDVEYLRSYLSADRQIACGLGIRELRRNADVVRPAVAALQHVHNTRPRAPSVVRPYLSLGGEVRTNGRPLLRMPFPFESRMTMLHRDRCRSAEIFLRRISREVRKRRVAAIDNGTGRDRGPGPWQKLSGSATPSQTHRSCVRIHCQVTTGTDDQRRYRRRQFVRHERNRRGFDRLGASPFCGGRHDSMRLVHWRHPYPFRRSDARSHVGPPGRVVQVALPVRQLGRVRQLEHDRPVAGLDHHRNQRLVPVGRRCLRAHPARGNGIPRPQHDHGLCVRAAPSR